MSKSVLITGGAGFIGSNFVPYFCRKYPDYHIVTLDKLTYAGDRSNLRECETLPNHILVEGDIGDRGLLDRLFGEYDFRGIVHFAAESHVDNSISDPENFIMTNVVGTYALLEAARKHWMSGPGAARAGYEGCRFHHISTDEVYGSLGDSGAFCETTPYAPNSPYSASKAASDFLVRAYHHTYGIDTTTSNCSNNYGPKQHPEKFIPTIIRTAIMEKPIPIYGKGTNVRDWLYVMDHCRAIDVVFHTGKRGETYAVGGNSEMTNLQVAGQICEILDAKRPRAHGNYRDLIAFVTDRPGHDLRYAINPQKIETELHWRPTEDFASGIVKTVEWYLSRA